MYKRKDGYYRLAKEQGYRSRASFKLIQLNDSYGIIHKNDSVLDIGAAPGGWMQVALGITGRQGTVVGVDLLGIPPIHAPNAHSIQGDINDTSVRQKALSAIRGRFDVVLSDLSVNLTGNAAADTEGNLACARAIVSFLPELLERKGNFLIKLFYSTDLKLFLRQAEQYFKTASVTKPRASRRSSSELYLVGKGFRGMIPDAVDPAGG